MTTVLDIDNIEDIPEPKICKFCNTIHHTCERCLKNSHMCLKCGKIIYFCSFCKEEFSTLSNLKKHDIEDKLCKKLKNLKEITVENQLQKFKKQRRTSVCYKS
jgi:hypothetical protein